MDTTTLVPGLLGGALIGLAAAALMLLFGRIAGISGIIGSLLQPSPGEVAWRLSFVGGLVAGGAALMFFYAEAFATTVSPSMPAIALAGLLVGFGTRMGSGCTSGHGICGVSRFSPRSLFATATFISTGALTVFVIERVLGGTL